MEKNNNIEINRFPPAARPPFCPLVVGGSDSGERLLRRSSAADGKPESVGSTDGTRLNRETVSNSGRSGQRWR